MKLKRLAFAVFLVLLIDVSMGLEQSSYTSIKFKDINITGWCGDFLCNDDETCVTCPSDCGVCPVIVEVRKSGKGNPATGLSVLDDVKAPSWDIFDLEHINTNNILFRGADFTDIFFVKNNLNETILVQIKAEGYLAEYTKFENKTATLKPAEKKEIEYTLSVPGDAVIGAYITKISLQTGNFSKSLDILSDVIDFNDPPIIVDIEPVWYKNPENYSTLVKTNILNPLKEPINVTIITELIDNRTNNVKEIFVDTITVDDFYSYTLDISSFSNLYNYKLKTSLYYDIGGKIFKEQIIENPEIIPEIPYETPKEKNYLVLFMIVLLILVSILLVVGYSYFSYYKNMRNKKEEENKQPDMHAKAEEQEQKTVPPELPKEQEVQPGVFEKTQELPENEKLFSSTLTNEKEYFWLDDGTGLKSLDELLLALEKMPEETFKRYVNSDKNDFANWIKSIFKNETFSSAIEKCKSKEELIGALNKLKKE